MPPKRKKKPYFEVGRKLAQLRNAIGLTQEQTAEKIDISLQYYQALEQGDKMAAYPTLVKIKKVLKASSWDEILP